MNFPSAKQTAGILALLSLACLTGTSVALELPDTEVPMHEKGTQTLYVDGAIDGFGQTEFMVDTGASYLAISESTLKQLLKNKTATHVRKLYGTMADGRSYPINIYAISRIQIGDACVLENIEAAALPGQTRNILGLSALRKTSPFLLDTDSRQLLLSNCETSEI